jgi:hypothetical protein
LHFHGTKPWNKKNCFYKEWKTNLENAELIDLSKIQNPRIILSEDDIKEYEHYLEKRISFWKCFFGIKNIK